MIVPLVYWDKPHNPAGSDDVQVASNYEGVDEDDQAR